MTKEHLGLALALNVPVFVVVTKIDMCPANILQGESHRLSPELFLTSVCVAVLCCSGITAGRKLLYLVLTALETPSRNLSFSLAHFAGGSLILTMSKLPMLGLS